MTLFLATHINKIDKKGRVSIPSSFRASLKSEDGLQFVAYCSYQYQAIECCTLTKMQQLSLSSDQIEIFSQVQDHYVETLFADAHQIFIDGEGRAILPENLLEFAGIDESASFVGRGSTFQIWHPDTFTIHQNQARQKLKERQHQLRQNSEGIL